MRVDSILLSLIIKVFSVRGVASELLIIKVRSEAVGVFFALLIFYYLMYNFFISKIYSS